MKSGIVLSKPEFSDLIFIKSFFQQNERILSLFKTGDFELMTHEPMALVKKVRPLDFISHQFRSNLRL